MQVKKQLGHRIAAMYHGAAAADRAQADFEQQFSRKGVPEDIARWSAPQADALGIKDLLVQTGLATSGSAAWRAVDQGAVSIDGVKISDRGHRQSLQTQFVLRLGRKMIRVEPAREASGS